MLQLIRVLQYALDFYSIILVIRIIVEWFRQANPAWRPKGLFLIGAELVYTVTDPPMKLVRKIIRPIRLGPVALDLSPMVLFVAIGLLSNLLNFIS